MCSCLPIIACLEHRLNALVVICRAVRSEDKSHSLVIANKWINLRSELFVIARVRVFILSTISLFSYMYNDPVSMLFNEACSIYYLATCH